MAIADLLLSTDFPIDKIVGFQSGNYSLPSGFQTNTINHGFGWQPLYMLRWSTDSDFATSFDERGVSFNFISVSASTSSANIQLTSLNQTGATVTIYYRVLYFLPTTVDMDSANTQSSLDSFFMNTDYNYTKIFSEGTTSPTSTINHGLGYMPQVEAWYVRQLDSRLSRVVQGASFSSPSSEPSVLVDDNIISFTQGSSPQSTLWHYKIYADSI